jgi:hypothetical protein
MGKTVEIRNPNEEKARGEGEAGEREAGGGRRGGKEIEEEETGVKNPNFVKSAPG